MRLENLNHFEVRASFDIRLTTETFVLVIEVTFFVILLRRVAHRRTKKMISNRFLFCCRIATFLNHKETIFNGLKNSRGRYLLRITGNSHLYESIHDYSTEANKPGTKQQNIKQVSRLLDPFSFSILIVFLFFFYRNPLNYC